LNTPGLFCIDADLEEVNRYRKAVDDGTFTFRYDTIDIYNPAGKDIFSASINVHLVTSLLKLYFQLLPNSVLTIYRSHTAKIQIDDDNQKVQVWQVHSSSTGGGFTATSARYQDGGWHAPLATQKISSDYGDYVAR
jgi:hypothetical protein